MSQRLTLLLCLLVVAASAGPVIATTEGRPVLSVHLPDNRVDAGEETTLEFYVLNAGRVDSGGTEAAQVTTARGVTVAVDAGDAPIEVRTATQPVGNVPEGRVGPVPFAITVAEDAEPGTYALPVAVSYTYTSETAEDDDDTPRERNVTIERTVDVVVESISRFPVVNGTADVAVGETGPFELHLRNDGATAVSDASVTVTAADPAVTFGDTDTTSTFVGDWAPGDIRTLTLSATVAAGADVRSYPLSVVVEYRADGENHASEAFTTGIEPRSEQTFAVEDVTSTLAVGDDGTIRGTVINTGDAAVSNGVVILTAGLETIVPGETEYAVGDLGSGESATFAFDASVTDSADAGPRQLSLVVRYRDAGDDVRRSEPLDARVVVGPRTDEFELEGVATTIGAGETGTLELRVTNAGDESVSDISAKLFTNDPLSSSDDEAFIDRLAPGESTTIRFALSAAPGALAKRYPVSLDFQYDDADGDTRLSDTYRVPVEVSRSENDGVSAAGIAGAMALTAALVGGLWYWRRR